MEYVRANFNGQENYQCEQITRSQEKQINGEKMVQKTYGQTHIFLMALSKDSRRFGLDILGLPWNS